LKENEQSPQVELSEDTLNKWQNIVDIIAELIGIPAALIMRLSKSDIEILISSQGDGNPYHPEDHPSMSRELLYTALTRHKNRIVIMHQGSRIGLKRFSFPHYSETAKRRTNLMQSCEMEAYPLVNDLNSLWRILDPILC